MPRVLGGRGASDAASHRRRFRGLARASPRVVVTLDPRWADEPGPWAIVPIVPGWLPERLLELAREADYTVLIAPETAGILAGLTRDLERAGARLLGSSPEAIELTGDKARLADWFEARGIPTPRTRTLVPADGLPGDWEYPAVLKPVDGAGSVDTYYLADRTSLPDARAVPPAVLQPYERGIPMSASFLVDDRSAAHLIGIGRQMMELQEGKFRYVGARCRSPARGRTTASIGGGVDFRASRVRRRGLPLGSA